MFENWRRFPPKPPAKNPMKGGWWRVNWWTKDGASSVMCTSEREADAWMREVSGNET